LASDSYKINDKQAAGQPARYGRVIEQSLRAIGACAEAIWTRHNPVGWDQDGSQLLSPDRLFPFHELELVLL
jgi:hypothetical protein